MMASASSSFSMSASLSFGSLLPAFPAPPALGLARKVMSAPPPPPITFSMLVMSPSFGMLSAAPSFVSFGAFSQVFPAPPPAPKTVAMPIPDNTHIVEEVPVAAYFAATASTPVSILPACTSFGTPSVSTSFGSLFKLLSVPPRAPKKPAAKPVPAKTRTASAFPVPTSLVAPVLTPLSMLLPSASYGTFLKTFPALHPRAPMNFTKPVPATTRTTTKVSASAPRPLRLRAIYKPNLTLDLASPLVLTPPPSPPRTPRTLTSPAISIFDESAADVYWTDLRCSLGACPFTCPVCSGTSGLPRPAPIEQAAPAGFLHTAFGREDMKRLKRMIRAELRVESYDRTVRELRSKLSTLGRLFSRAE